MQNLVVVPHSMAPNNLLKSEAAGSFPAGNGTVLAMLCILLAMLCMQNVTKSPKRNDPATKRAWFGVLRPKGGLSIELDRHL